MNTKWQDVYMKLFLSMSSFTTYKNIYYAYAIFVLDESFIKSLLSVTKKLEEITLFLSKMFMHK